MAAISDNTEPAAPTFKSAQLGESRIERKISGVFRKNGSEIFVANQNTAELNNTKFIES